MAETMESLRLRLEVYESDMDGLHKRIAELTKELDISRKATERFRKLASKTKGEMGDIVRVANELEDLCMKQVADARRRAALRVKAVRAECDEWRMAVHEVGIAAS
jgi:predicted  nucleic acid-binding Zn-ribbon protein